jgi:sulfofructosephosphate aldolase
VGITAVAARVTAVLDCPWVVLSSGVTADDFPAAVQACEAGGADGFLAGRAIWADAVSADDPAEFLRTVSAARLRTMATG